VALSGLRGVKKRETKNGLMRSFIIFTLRILIGELNEKEIRNAKKILVRKLLKYIVRDLKVI
jgi:hypothetical protein